MPTENNPNTNPYTYEAPFSFAIWLHDWTRKIKTVVKARYKLIFIIAVLGAALGLAYSQIKSIRYKFLDLTRK